MIARTLASDNRDLSRRAIAIRRLAMRSAEHASRPDVEREVEAIWMLADAGQFGESPLFTSASSLEPGPSFGVTQLAAGARLGPYDVTAALGAGGMGEVYRAHDSRLSRDVAIKMLPPAFDTPIGSRFRREARMLASLNHPNIAAIYGVERSGDVDPGPGLWKARDAQRPLPVAVARLCNQVAGHWAAHGKGISTAI
jgi:serine/threonine protein kinase